MTSGWGLCKGFVSIMSLTLMMTLSSLILMQLIIMENVVSFETKVEQLDKRGYIEVLVMHHIKDAYRTNTFEENMLISDECTVSLFYDQTEVLVKFEMDMYEWIRKYRYDSSSECLMFVND